MPMTLPIILISGSQTRSSAVAQREASLRPTQTGTCRWEPSSASSRRVLSSQCDETRQTSRSQDLSEHQRADVFKHGAKVRLVTLLQRKRIFKFRTALRTIES